MSLILNITRYPRKRVFVFMGSDPKYMRQYWHDHPEYRASTATGKVRRSIENHRYIFEYLKTHPCVDCPESDPLVLQFDHIILSEKKGCVTGFTLSSRKRIDEEIARCVVRCASCHVRKTAKERNSIRYQLVQQELNPDFVIERMPTPKSRPEPSLSPIEAGKLGAKGRWG